MYKISFDSRYKFIVSLGIMLSIFPFIAIYTLSEMSEDVLISNKIMEELDKTSIEIIKMKQDIYLKILSSIIFYIFIIIIFLCGLILIVRGLKMWGKVQNQEYRKLELENEHVELENRHLKIQFGLSKDQQMSKVEREINEEVQILGKESSDVTKYEYFDIEQAVADKILEKFAFTHDVVKGCKLGDIEYDVVAKAKKFLDKDYFFEIKYLKSMVSEQWYKRMLYQIDIQYENYLNKTNHLPYIQIIIVTENENYDKVRKFVYKHQKINNQKISVVKRSEIYNCDLYL